MLVRCVGEYVPYLLNRISFNYSFPNTWDFFFLCVIVFCGTANLLFAVFVLLKCGKFTNRVASSSDVRVLSTSKNRWMSSHLRIRSKQVTLPSGIRFNSPTIFKNTSEYRVSGTISYRRTSVGCNNNFNCFCFVRTTSLQQTTL